MRLKSDTYTIMPPLFQPLRLWTPRVPPVPKSASHQCCNDSASVKKEPLRTFSMRGGFVTVADGERRLMIAGKLFQSRGAQ